MLKGTPAFLVSAFLVTPASAMDAPVACNPGPDLIGAEVTMEDYPLVSIGLLEEGRAVLEVDVTTEGRASYARIAASTGSFRLDERAVEILNEKWRFTPGRIGDAPAICPTRVAVRWALNRGDGPRETSTDAALMDLLESREALPE